MKKSLSLLAMVPALILVSCGGPKVDTSKIALDYGEITSSQYAYSDFHELSYDELDATISDKSSFVLVTFNDRTCGCWRDFQPLFVKFANEHHYKVKLFDVALLSGHSQTFGIYSATSQMPGICFFKRGKLIRQSVYGKNAENNRKMFKNYEYFEPFMLENVYLPKFYYIDKDILEAKKYSNGNFNLYVAKTNCPDCARIEKDFMYGWIDKNGKKTLIEDIYIFDIYPYVGQDNYQQIKDEAFLSTIYNTDFGYNTGYVPTFQRWSNGSVIDMITVLNDSVDANRVVTSYFNQARVSKSPLLKDTGDQYIFDGKVVGPDDVITGEYQGHTYTMLSQDTQFKWHKPITELFFNEYFK